MASKEVQLSMWEQLPKKERERMTRELLAAGKVEPAKNGKPRTGFQLKGYIRCDLSVTEKDGFREWEQQHTAVECYGQLVKAVDSGYLLKVGESGQGFQATLCASSTGLTWDGYVLTAHAAHAERAVILLIYKHEVLLQSDWSESMQEDGEDFMR